MSTPTMLRLPDEVRRVDVRTSRGTFAALEAMPSSGVAERMPALLIPGYTGSKEDFLPVLVSLAAAGRRVVAIDMRGQYESPRAADAQGYHLASLAADVALIAEKLARPDSMPAASSALPPRARASGKVAHGGSVPPGARTSGKVAHGGSVHLLGHSFGGLVARETLLARTGGIGSLALMSSGPGALSGPRAQVLRAVLAGLSPSNGLDAQVRRVWRTQMEPAAVADGVPAEIVAFLRQRLLRSCPTGLWAMGRQLLACSDRTAEVAGLNTPLLVVYGENDDAWAPAIQDDMARRLGAHRVCIPGAAHSPAVEAPETCASTLTAFWNSAETA